MLQDFRWECDINNDKCPVEFVVPAQDTLYVDSEDLCDFLKKHLVEEIINKRGIKPYPNYDDAFKNILKEVSVDLNV